MTQVTHLRSGRIIKKLVMTAKSAAVGGVQQDRDLAKTVVGKTLHRTVLSLQQATRILQHVATRIMDEQV